MEWCIYVGRAASNNFRTGLQNGLWGHKNVSRTSRLPEIKAGDTVHFFHDITRVIPPVGNEKKGNLRLSADNYTLLGGYAREVITCEVTKGFYQSNTAVWPDDTYPNRFNIKKVDEKSNVLIGVEVQGDEVIQALLRSITNRGDAVPLDNASVNFEGEFEPEDEDDESGSTEGRPLYRMHRQRERDKKIVHRKKALAEENNQLKCEACGFDFQEVYGERGKGYIECHHNRPLFERNENEETRLEDLALVCSNCHRMIHRKKRWLTIEELRGLIS